jgi:hypothetical protein
MIESVHGIFHPGNFNIHASFVAFINFDESRFGFQNGSKRRMVGVNNQPAIFHAKLNAHF